MDTGVSSEKFRPGRAARWPPSLRREPCGLRLRAGLRNPLRPAGRHFPVLQAEGVPVLEVAFWRAVLGGLCFLTHAALTDGLRVRPLHVAYFCLFGFLGIGMMFSTVQGAIRESGAALAMMLMFSTPIWVAVFSRLIFQESITPRKAGTLALALLGIALICLSGGSLAGQAPRPSALPSALVLALSTHYV